MASFTVPGDATFDSVAPATGVPIFRDSGVLSLLVAFEDSPQSAHLKLRGSFDAHGDVLRMDSATWTVAGAQTSVSFAGQALSATLQWHDGSTRIDDLWKTLLSGDDRVTLGEHGDRIDLGAGDDVVRAGAGDDTLWGGAGDDVLRGDEGVDTAAWGYAAANYALALEPGAIRVADRTGGDGVDALFDVERLRFADRTVIVDTRAHGSYADLPLELYHFFIVAFNAAPGVEYMDQLAGAYRWWLPAYGADTVRQIVEVFTTKQQFTDVYPTTMTHQALAQELVAQIVKESASEAAKQDAVDDIRVALDLGGEWTVGKVIYTVFGNLARKDPDDPVWGGTSRQFHHEIAVAQYYTEVLNQCNEDLATLRAVLRPVGPDTDVGTTESIVQLIGVGLMEG